MDGLLVVLTFTTGLGCGLSAGALFAFSSFVMKALARLQPAQGIAAMQSINVLAVTPVFMTALLGTGVLCVALGAWALADWHEASSPWLLAGGLLYVVGTIGVTVVYHVPRNDALAEIDPNDSGAHPHWQRYLDEWTRWNHLRVAAGLAAAAALTKGIHVG